MKSPQLQIEKITDSGNNTQKLKRNLKQIVIKNI